ncbi:MAG: hypothetical protein KF736_01580 [Acidobacteria bacterium]|nr:hypothetical protein [Acidobacteriota bacterium]MCW5948167.1 hypothetical protein [Pyrinomonadaceae bacterium]
MTDSPSFVSKLAWNLPWMVRYPWTRLRSYGEMTAFEKKHVVITIADHFEPAWNDGPFWDLKGQIRRLKEFREMARRIAALVRDVDDTGFRHTFFYPAEQYDPSILEIMSEMQAEGLGETEVHLHHGGYDVADTSENLRRTLLEFRDTLAERHRLLSRTDPNSDPMYAFVHGNLALGNSSGGQHCGVDDELQILRETGCYIDMTLPSAPDRSQVPMLNQIYEPGRPLDAPVPHRTGRRVAADGRDPRLPMILTGPLVFYLPRRFAGLPLPRLDDGALAGNQAFSPERLRRWMSANVTVAGRSDLVFVKLYCHGFFDHDQQACIGEDAIRFFSELLERSNRNGEPTIHFASARETFNMVCAAIDGKTGEPNQYRNYRLRPIMAEGKV